MTGPLPVPHHASGVVARPPGRHSVRWSGRMWDHSPAACQLPSHHDRPDPSPWCKNLLIRKVGELSHEESPRLHPD
jgi:hypothetical protein